jgi:ATP-dependent helicase HrpA
MRLRYTRVADNPDPDAELPKDLLDELLVQAFDQAFLPDPWSIRDPAAFDACREQGRPGLGPALLEITGLVGEILAAADRVRSLLSTTTQGNWADSVSDMKMQLDGLVYRGFLQQTAKARLIQFPRYLNALGLRVEKLQTAALRDRRQMHEMEGVLRDWLEREHKARAQGTFDERLDEIRWMLEELRVSLFAQGLKTAYPISVKRVRKRWQSLGL